MIIFLIPDRKVINMKFTLNHFSYNNLIVIILLFSTLFYAQASTNSITLTKITDSYPAINRTNGNIFFSSNRDGDYDIFKYDTLSKQTFRVIDLQGDEGHPDISPDGKLITFFATIGDIKNNKREIYIAYIDGSDVRRLTNNPHGAFHPKFHPKGKHILYNRKVDSGEDKYELYEIDIETGESKKLLSDERNITYASYSPNGEKIVFVKWFENMNTEIYLADKNGNNQKNISNHKLFDGWPCWSIDGEKIIFASDRDKKFHFHLYSYNLDSGRIEAETTGDNQFVQPSYSEDGILANSYPTRSTSTSIVRIKKDES
jgi:Tol biopolymer transport system component